MGKTKTIKLKESEFKDYVKHIVLEKISTFFGEAPSFPMKTSRRYGPATDLLLEKSLLEEGLTRTYPMEWVEKYLKTRLSPDCLSAWSNPMSRHICFRFPEGSGSVEPLKAAMVSFGYFCSVDETLDGKEWLQFEPKFDECVKGSEFAARPGQMALLHVSPKRHRHKILKQGLAPKSDNDFLDYPDRVYFISASEGFDAAHEMADLLYTHDQKQTNDGEYVLYGITLDGLEDTKFYLDRYTDNWHAYFTYGNIPPKNIIELEQFKANKL